MDRAVGQILETPKPASIFSWVKAFGLISEYICMKSAFPSEISAFIPMRFRKAVFSGPKTPVSSGWST